MCCTNSNFCACCYNINCFFCKIVCFNSNNLNCQNRARFYIFSNFKCKGDNIACDSCIFNCHINNSNLERRSKIVCACYSPTGGGFASLFESGFNTGKGETCRNNYFKSGCYKRSGCSYINNNVCNAFSNGCGLSCDNNIARRSIYFDTFICTVECAVCLLNIYMLSAFIFNRLFFGASANCAGSGFFAVCFGSCGSGNFPFAPVAFALISNFVSKYISYTGAFIHRVTGENICGITVSTCNYLNGAGNFCICTVIVSYKLLGNLNSSAVFCGRNINLDFPNILKEVVAGERRVTVHIYCNFIKASSGIIIAYVLVATASACDRCAIKKIYNSFASISITLSERVVAGGGHKVKNVNSSLVINALISIKGYFLLGNINIVCTEYRAEIDAVEENSLRAGHSYTVN